MYENGHHDLLPFSILVLMWQQQINFSCLDVRRCREGLDLGVGSAWGEGWYGNGWIREVIDELWYENGE